MRLRYVCISLLNWGRLAQWVRKLHSDLEQDFQFKPPPLGFGTQPCYELGGLWVKFVTNK